MKLIVANWKMNPSTLQEALTLGSACDHEGVILCVPFPYIAPLQGVLKHAKLGAQDIAPYAQGPYTGDVSPVMLKDMGCEYAIIGHSERRRLYREDKKLVHEKIITATSAGLIPILCVADLGEVEEVPIIAYEPDGAISTRNGAAASLQDIEAMGQCIHSMVPHALVLYGGSVTASNAASILELKSVNGVLVGAASLDPEEFQKIVHYGNC